MKSPSPDTRLSRSLAAVRRWLRHSWLYRLALPALGLWDDLRELMRSDMPRRRPRSPFLELETLDVRLMPANFSFQSGAFSVAESVGSTPVTVVLDQAVPAGQTWTVDYSTANGSAGSNDFTAISTTTLVFTAGMTSVPVPVTINNDSLDEFDEDFTATLANASGASLGSPITTTITITDNDAEPTLTGMGNPTYAESAGTVPFSVNLSAASGKTITVDYATSNGTAISGSDYTGASGTLTIAPGSTSAFFNVSITQDSLDEDNETFTYAFTNVVNSSFSGSSSGTVTITDDDATPTQSFSAVVTVAETAGTALMTVTLDAASGRTVTVDYATTAMSATAGVDYTTTTGTLTFAPGQTTKNVIVPITDDQTSESTEYIMVTISNPTNVNLGSAWMCMVGITDTSPTAWPASAAGPTGGPSGLAELGLLTGNVQLVLPIDCSASGFG